jgi:PAS domain S-box-containing protein
MSRASQTKSQLIAELEQLQARVQALEQRERDLSEALARFRMIERAIQKSEHGIAIADSSKIVRFANPAWAGLHGYEPDEVIGMPLSSFHNEEQLRSRADMVQEDIEALGSYAGAMGHLRKDGSTFTSWLTMSRLSGAENGEAGFVVTIRDITRQTQAEDALRESEARFKSLFGGIPVPTYIYRMVGDDFELANYNDAAVALTHGEIARLVGERISAMYPDKPEILADMRRCFAEKSSLSKEMFHRLHSSGEDKYLTVTYAFVPPDLVMVNAEDISDRKRTADELRRSEMRFKAQFTGIPVPTYIWRNVGDDFELVDYNTAAAVSTREKVKDFLGSKLSVMYKDDPDIIEDMHRCFREQNSVSREMLYHYRMTPQSRYLIVKYAYVPPDLVIVHTQDITERKEAEDALRESEVTLHEAQRIARTGSWQIDLISRTQTLSPMMRDIYGFDRLTVTNKETFARVHPEDRPKTIAAYRKALHGDASPVEYRIVRPNGDVRIVFTPGARLYRNAQGKPVRMIGVTQDITERKQADAALWESEERFRQLAENITDVFWLLDWTEQKIIYVSPAYEKAWGRPAQQLYDDPLDWVDAVHPNDRERVLEAYLPAAVTSFNEVYRIFRPDGELRWIHHRGFPIEDETGRVYRMAGIAEDITAHKLSDVALRKSEERYRALYDDNPSMYFTVDAEGTVLAVNKFGAAQLGYSVQELVGRSVLDIFHGDDRSAVKGQLVASLQTPGRIAHWEYRKICKDGRVMYVEEAARSVIDADGRPVVLVACEDVTNRRRVEEALVDSERRFRTLTSLAPVGIFETDEHGEYLFVNEKWCELAGMSAEEARGAAWSHILDPGDQDRISAEWRAATNAGREFATEFRVSTPQGEATWLFAVALAMHDAKGQTTGYLGSITDITELKRIEAALRESEERYRLLYDNNPSMFFTLSLDGTVLSVNKFGAEQLGYTVEELYGQSVFDVFHPDDRDAVRRQLAACGKHLGEIARWELRKITKDGRVMPVREAARAIEDREGRTIVFIVCEEIT